MAARLSHEQLTTKPRAAHLGPARRRPQILDVAMELFLRGGYKGTSMEQIAQAAGVTKPVVYDCFASKAELFGALIDREEQRIFDHFGPALAAGSELGDLEGTLIAGFTSMLRAVAHSPERYRAALLSAGDADAAIYARVRQGRERQVLALAAVARSWLRGRVDEDRLEAVAQFAAHTIVGIGEAGVRLMLTQPQRWTPERLGVALGKLAAGGYASFVVR